MINDTIVVVNHKDDRIQIYYSNKWSTVSNIPKEKFLPNDSTDICQGRRIYRNNCFPCHIKSPEKKGIHITFNNRFYELKSNSVKDLDEAIELSDRGKPVFINKNYFINHGTHDYYWTINKRGRQLLVNYLKTEYRDSIEPCSDASIAP